MAAEANQPNIVTVNPLTGLQLDIIVSSKIKQAAVAKANDSALSAIALTVVEDCKVDIVMK